MLVFFPSLQVCSFSRSYFSSHTYRIARKKNQSCWLNIMLSAKGDDGNNDDDDAETNVQFLFWIAIAVVIVFVATRKQGKKNDGDFLHFFFRLQLIADACYDKRVSVCVRERQYQEQTLPSTASHVVVVVWVPCSLQTRDEGKRFISFFLSLFIDY